MIKVTVECGKITIQGQSSEECKDILNSIYDKFVEANKCTSPIIKVNDDMEENYITFDNDMVLLNSKEEPDNKRLIFYKCEECGTTAFSYTNPHSKVKCHCCNSNINLGDLYRGTYKCSCGQRGVFLMQESVSEVECKKCKSKHIMIKEGNEYVAL